MIDWDRVETLRQEIGTADFAEVVALFLEPALFTGLALEGCFGV